jgi:hypothetical protein
MDKAKMAYKVWKEIKRYWREILTRSGYKSSDTCGVCGNIKSKAKRNKKGETVCEATEKDCKENKGI